MKIFNNLPKILLLILIVTTAFVGCKNDDDNTPADPEEQILIDQLVGTWIPGTVSLDNVDKTNEFQNFELTFNANKTFNAVNGKSAFPANGTWDFHPDDEEELIRGDGVEMEYNVDEDVLELRFTISSSEYADRSFGMTGEYSMDLQRK